jgi:hypothetical protein
MVNDRSRKTVEYADEEILGAENIQVRNDISPLMRLITGERINDHDGFGNVSSDYGAGDMAAGEC